MNYKVYRLQFLCKFEVFFRFYNNVVKFKYFVIRYFEINESQLIDTM